jgi:hypothetical protein
MTLRNRRQWLGAALGAAVIFAAGCGSEASPVRSPFDDRGPQPTVPAGVPNFPPPFPAPTRPTTPPPATSTPAVEAIATAAIDMLASRMGVPATRFTVDRVEAVTWPDGCLGISTPGIACTQALVPGYRVVLRASTGSLHEVRTGAGGVTAWAPQATIHATVEQPGATLALIDAGGKKITALVGGGTQLVEVTLGALKAGDEIVIGADDLGDGSPLRVAWLAREP